MDEQIKIYWVYLAKSDTVKTKKTSHELPSVHQELAKRQLPWPDKTKALPIQTEELIEWSLRPLRWTKRDKMEVDDMEF